MLRRALSARGNRQVLCAQWQCGQWGCRVGDAAKRPRRAQQQTSLARTWRQSGVGWRRDSVNARSCVCRSVCGCEESLVIAAPRLSALTSTHAQIPCCASHRGLQDGRYRCATCSERMQGDDVCECGDRCYRCATRCPFCLLITCEFCAWLCTCERVRRVARRLLWRWRWRAVEYAWRPNGPRARALVASFAQLPIVKDDLAPR